jgi:hypothetical protein
LTSAGFHVSGLGTASNIPVAKTTITYQANRTSSMQALSSALKIAPEQVIDAAAGSKLTLTLGADWAGLAAPSASPTAGGSPSGTASPGLKATSATNASCVQG